MRHETCPKCEGSLVVPDKKRGKSVECPVCKTSFIASVESKVAKKKKKKPGSLAAEKPFKPSMRSIPVPSALKDELPDEQPKPSSSKGNLKSSPLDPPKSKTRLVAPGPPSPPTAPSKKSSKHAAVAEAQSPVKASKNSGSKSELAKPVARIIEAAPVTPTLTTEGQLPTLQLVDDNKPKETETKLAENPAFLGLLVCGSIVLSTVMILLAGATPESTRGEVEEARIEIRGYYEVKPGDEPKQYQVELRQAQLAHSRGDHRSEIRVYQKLLGRFRSEDRNQYSGVTGSPTWDTELQELVSTLLNEAKRLSKKTGR